MLMDQNTLIILSENLKNLMNHHELSQSGVAEKAGIAQTTITNILHPGRTKKGPALGNIESLAKSFGLETWHLLIPNQPIESLLSKSVEKLVSNYNAIDESGRQNISRISENEMRYCENYKKLSNGT